MDQIFNMVKGKNKSVWLNFNVIKRQSSYLTDIKYSAIVLI